MSLKSSVIDEHGEVAELLPWYVNGTLPDAGRLRVEKHVRTCEPCRQDLEREQQLYQAMRAEPDVEYMPAASLKALTASVMADPRQRDAVLAVSTTTGWTAPRRAGSGLSLPYRRRRLPARDRPRPPVPARRPGP